MQKNSKYGHFSRSAELKVSTTISNSCSLYFVLSKEGWFKHGMIEAILI